MRNSRVGRHRQRLGKPRRFRVDWLIWGVAGLAVAAVAAAAVWAIQVL